MLIVNIRGEELGYFYQQAILHHEYCSMLLRGFDQVFTRCQKTTVFLSKNSLGYA